MPTTAASIAAALRLHAERIRHLAARESLPPGMRTELVEEAAGIEKEADRVLALGASPTREL